MNTDHLVLHLFILVAFIHFHPIIPDVFETEATDDLTWA